jgi:hypothetical protein
MTGQVSVSASISTASAWILTAVCLPRMLVWSVGLPWVRTQRQQDGRGHVGSYRIPHHTSTHCNEVITGERWEVDKGSEFEQDCEQNREQNVLSHRPRVDLLVPSAFQY